MQKSAATSIWLVESLRLTLMYKDSVPPNANGCWERLVGEVPEEQKHLPRAMTVQEDGKWGKGNLAAITTDMRADLIYVGVVNPEDQIAQPSLGQIDDAFSEFCELG